MRFASQIPLPVRSGIVRAAGRALLGTRQPPGPSVRGGHDPEAWLGAKQPPDTPRDSHSEVP